MASCSGGGKRKTFYNFLRRCFFLARPTIKTAGVPPRWKNMILPHNKIQELNSSETSCDKIREVEDKLSIFQY
jgi:hypothetical protein